MNRNAAATRTMDTGKRCAGSACWSGEWSFIEDADAALPKSVWPPITEKQPVVSHANASSDSS